jgi:hypothetical protein
MGSTNRPKVRKRQLNRIGSNIEGQTANHDAFDSHIGIPTKRFVPRYWCSRLGSIRPNGFPVRSEQRRLVGRGYPFFDCRFPNRTPGPPPFSLMNSTPAASSARRTAKSLAAVSAVWGSASSARRIVRKLTVEWLERSSALHRSRARAALICALLRAFLRS